MFEKWTWKKWVQFALVVVTAIIGSILGFTGLEACAPAQSVIVQNYKCSAAVTGTDGTISLTDCIKAANDQAAEAEAEGDVDATVPIDISVPTGEDNP